MREFETGATRSALGDKPEYAGYLSPTALKAFGAYMLKHQLMENGQRRDSRNWQKGIPMEAYIQSTFRHFMSVWGKFEAGESADVEELCALMFNVQGMLHETLKGESA